MKQIESTEYVKTKTTEQQQMDPKHMQTTMQMMKKNLVMFIPQTLIMSWISYFFSGFVLTRLPFPLTLRFKEMVQRGIDTQDMDVGWVSSLSWYFLNLFGLTSVYTLVLNGGNSGSMDMVNMQMSNSNPLQQPAEIAKMFENEGEFLGLLEYKSVLDGVEDRVLDKYSRGMDKKLK